MIWPQGGPSRGRLVVNSRSGVDYWLQLQLGVDISGKFEIFKVFILYLQIGVIAKGKWKSYIGTIFHLYFHLQLSL